MDMRIILLVLSIFFILIGSADALICGIYFTDSNSPDCQIIDEYIENQTDLADNLTLIKYDLAESVNVGIANDYLEQYISDESYNFPGSAPFILFSENHHLAGIDEIKECLSLKVEYFLEEGGNSCPVLIYTPPPGNGDDGNGGGGSPGDESGILGDPEIKIIATENPKEPSQESIDNGIEEKKNNEEIEFSEDIIREKIKEKEMKESQERIFEQLPYAYIALLIIIIAIALSIYIKKSR